VGAPAFVEGDQGPADAGREVAKDDLGGGVDVEGGGDQVEVRRIGAEAGVGEVAVLLEVAEAGGAVDVGEVVVADADPVVEALEGEVEVFAGFDFDDGEAVGAGDGEEVEHSAVEVAAGAGEGGDLGVDGGGLKVGVEGREVGAEGAFEPAFGLGAEEDVLCGRKGGFGGWLGAGSWSGLAAAEEVADEIAQLRLRFGEEGGFAGAGADGDLELAVEGLAGEGGADAGELEAVEEEGEFSVGAQAELTAWCGGGEVSVAVGWVGGTGCSCWSRRCLDGWRGRRIEAEDCGAGWEEGQDLWDGVGEAIEGGSDVWRMDEASGEVSMVGWIARGEVFGLLVELEQLEVCYARVEPGEARKGGGGGAARKNKAQAPVEAALARGGRGGVIAAVLQPEDPDGENAVDGGLGFGRVNGDDGPGFLTPGEGAAGVGGTEGALEIHGGAKALGAEIGEGAEEDPV